MTEVSSKLLKIIILLKNKHIIIFKNTQPYARFWMVQF